MSKAKKISFKGTKEYQGEAAQAVPAPGDAVLVVRGVARSLVMRCPDGCGELLTVNLDERSGPAWRIYEAAGKYTLYPSVWRKTGCLAHFILWRDHLLWCDWDETPTWRDEEFRARVRATLPESHALPLHYEEIAERLDAVPWEALWACQDLVKDGVASAYEKFTRFRLKGAAPITGSRIA